MKTQRSSLDFADTATSTCSRGRIETIFQASASTKRQRFSPATQTLKNPAVVCRTDAHACACDGTCRNPLRSRKRIMNFRIPVDADHFLVCACQREMLYEELVSNRDVIWAVRCPVAGVFVHKLQSCAGASVQLTSEQGKLTRFSGINCPEICRYLEMSESVIASSRRDRLREHHDWCLQKLNF